MIRTAIARKAPSTEPKPPRGPRRKLCACCRSPFVPMTPMGRACSIDCAIKIAVQVRQVAERKDDRARKQAIKTKGDHVAAAQTAFNAYCRARDRGEQCISCDMPLATVTALYGGGVDCGHFRSRGSAPHLRFDERNAHGQCKRCNRYLSGNVTEYRPRLIARIGLAAVEALEADQTPRKYTVEQLIEIKIHYRARLKALTKGEA